MTSSVTICEYEHLPDANGLVTSPASVETTITVPGTHNVSDRTQYAEVFSDATYTDGRIGFNKAAVASGTNISPYGGNKFKLAPGTGRTFQFI